MAALVVVPEPAFWLDAIREDFPGVEPFAPWALGRSPPPLVPGPVRRFWHRRQLAGSAGFLPWQLLDAASRMWARGQTDRNFDVRFSLRAAADFLAARKISATRPARVIAPSCAAWRSFAAARQVGAETVLVEDFPDLRGLHRDLDRAANAHPSCSFLRRYRAPTRVLVRQEVERALADRILVRGHHARAERVASGVSEDQLAALTLPPPPPLTRAGGTGHVLLAGLAAARHGTVEALALIAARPEIKLYVRLGEGAEPPALHTHPRVVPYGGEPLDAVLAPAWCESYPSEVAAARAADIPVIATARAAGFSDIIAVEPGDTAALIAAVDHIVLDRSSPQ